MEVLTKVNRIEVIDWSGKSPGRVFTKWEDQNVQVSFDIQDDGKTLKIFLEDADADTIHD